MSRPLRRFNDATLSDEWRRIDIRAICMGIVWFVPEEVIEFLEKSSFNGTILVLDIIFLTSSVTNATVVIVKKCVKLSTCHREMVHRGPCYSRLQESPKVKRSDRKKFLLNQECRIHPYIWRTPKLPIKNDLLGPGISSRWYLKDGVATLRAWNFVR